MKSFKNILFSAFLTLGAFGAVTYTSCNKDECKDVVCQNGGTCSNGNCACPAGFEGNLCQDKTNVKYAGTYTAVDNIGSYIVTITADPSNPTKVLVKNLGDYGCTIGGDITWDGITSSTMLTINDTKCATTLNGSFNYSNVSNITTLTGSYTATYGATTDNINVVLTKN